MKVKKRKITSSSASSSSRSCPVAIGITSSTFFLRGPSATTQIQIQKPHTHSDLRPSFSEKICEANYLNRSWSCGRREMRRRKSASGRAIGWLRRRIGKGRRPRTPTRRRLGLGFWGERKREVAATFLWKECVGVKKLWSQVTPCRVRAPAAESACLITENVNFF